MLILLIVLGLAGIGGGVVYLKNKNKAVTMESPTPTPTPTPMPEGMMKARTMTVKLASQNDSRQAGEAVLTEVEGDKVKVVLSLSGAPTGVAQPAHIHAGACPTPGAVKYPLTSVTNGASQTELDVTLDELVAQLPLAVNVHKSSTEAGVHVACGDVKANMMQGGDGMMDGGMMQGAVKEFTIVGTANMKFSLNEMKVKKGDKVKVTFKNEGGFHDWMLDEFSAKTKQLQAGQSETVEFVADKVGTFEYYCSVGQHRAMGMKGSFVVTE